MLFQRPTKPGVATPGLSPSIGNTPPIPKGAMPGGPGNTALRTGMPNTGAALGMASSAGARQAGLPGIPAKGGTMPGLIPQAAKPPGSPGSPGSPGGGMATGWGGGEGIGTAGRPSPSPPPSLPPGQASRPPTGYPGGEGVGNGQMPGYSQQQQSRGFPGGEGVGNGSMPGGGGQSGPSPGGGTTPGYGGYDGGSGRSVSGAAGGMGAFGGPGSNSLGSSPGGGGMLGNSSVGGGYSSNPQTAGGAAAKALANKAWGNFQGVRQQGMSGAANALNQFGGGYTGGGVGSMMGGGVGMGGRGGMPGGAGGGMPGTPQHGPTVIGNGQAGGNGAPRNPLMATLGEDGVARDIPGTGTKRGTGSGPVGTGSGKGKLNSGRDTSNSQPYGPGKGQIKVAPGGNKIDPDNPTLGTNPPRRESGSEQTEFDQRANKILSGSGLSGANGVTPGTRSTAPVSSMAEAEDPPPQVHYGSDGTLEGEDFGGPEDGSTPETTPSESAGNTGPGATSGQGSTYPGVAAGHDASVPSSGLGGGLGGLPSSTSSGGPASSGTTPGGTTNTGNPGSQGNPSGPGGPGTIPGPGPSAGPPPGQQPPPSKTGPPPEIVPPPTIGPYPGTNPGPITGQPPGTIPQSGNGNGNGGTTIDKPSNVGSQGYATSHGENASQNQGASTSENQAVSQGTSTGVSEGQGTSTSTGRSGSNVLHTFDPTRVKELLGGYLNQVGAVDNPYTPEQFQREANRGDAAIAATGNRRLSDLEARAKMNGADSNSAALLMGRSGILADVGKQQMQNNSQLSDKYKQNYGNFALQQAGQGIAQRGQDVSQRGLDADLMKTLYGQTESFSNQDANSQNTSRSNQNAQNTSNSTGSSDAWNWGNSNGINDSYSEWWPIISAAG